jgi:hypothetical protein
VRRVEGQPVQSFVARQRSFLSLRGANRLLGIRDLCSLGSW